MGARVRRGRLQAYLNDTRSRRLESRLMSVQPVTSPSTAERLDLHDLQQLEDIGFMTCMTLVLLGNYAQTGHFGGPLAYTPFNVATHLAGRERGGLHYDYRRPKHPYCDKFMLAAGHCAPTCYALWMIMGEALARKYEATGDRRYYVAPELAMLPVDALGFRRGAGALKTLLAGQRAGRPSAVRAGEGPRHPRAVRPHRVDRRHNDVNGGPSGVGIATAAGKAAFWDIVGAALRLAEDHRVRRRVRDVRGPRAGAEDAGDGAAGRQAAAHLLLRQQRRHRRRAASAAWCTSKFDGYELRDQWTSYGWNVFDDCRRPRLRADPRRAEDDGGLGSRPIAGR